jgi:hypothetical protein
MVNYPKKEPLPPDGTIYKEGCYEPHRLRDNGRRKFLLENICKMVSKATPIHTAFIANGIPLQTYHTWKRKYNEELEEIKGTNYRTMLTEFFGAIYEADGSTEARLGGVMFRKAIDEEDTDATKYLLDKRYKWKETKQVEVDTAEDKTFELNIVPMEDKLADDEEETDEE